MVYDETVVETVVETGCSLNSNDWGAATDIYALGASNYMPIT